ncbi:MAG: thioredoxin family protein [Caulobacteraceae bacterium]|nr:thioredoxin family protein [Caulobacteraceae bacterium]
MAASWRTILAAAFAALLAGAAGAGRTAPAPRMAITSFAQLPTPLPLPYDPGADARAQVAAAKARAAAAHKLLLIDLGGDWCPDCRILAATIEQPDLKAFVQTHYEVVTVDVGFLDKNLDIPARYGISGRLEGVPSLLIIDPRTDALLDRGHIAALADARHMTPQALADWLAKWTP